MKVLKIFPSFFTYAEGMEVGREISFEEINTTLKSFAKDKSPGPDEWLAEFFLAFVDILGKDSLDIVKFCRKEKFMIGGLNATFLTLISKKENPVSFVEFKPISLFNLIY